MRLSVLTRLCGACFDRILLVAYTTILYKSSTWESKQQHSFNKTCPKGVLFSCWWVECTAYAPRHCAPPLQTTGLCSPSPSVRAPVPDRVEGCRLDPARGSRQARTRRADGFGGWEAKAVRRADSQPRARRGRRRVGERRAWTPVAGSGSDAATSSEPVANTRFEWGRCEE